MELRHLRYFAAVAEEGSFTRAGARLRVAQPALSRQIRQLESEVGVALLERSPRGVTLTAAGEAFLIEARRAIEHAGLATETARGASRAGHAALRFSHGQLLSYVGVAEELLAGFRSACPEVKVVLTSQHDSQTHDALVDGRVDVGCVFSAEWPQRGFDGHRLFDLSARGVLLPASHPLATAASVSLRDLRGLPWLTSGPERWPGFFDMVGDALRARGLEPKVGPSPPPHSPFIHVAAGAGWTLANEKLGAPYRGKSSAIVYRTFVEPPIPFWLSLVWVTPAPRPVERLVEAAQSLGFVVGDEPERKARSKGA